MRVSPLLWLSLAEAAVIPRLQPRAGNYTNGNSTWPGGQCGAISSSSPISLAIPASPPSGAFVVPGDFIGFGFDSGFINNYAGSFSQNLVDGIANRIPGPIIIRIGGTSQDKLTFDPNQSQAVTCSGSGCPAGPGTTLVIGPSYFDGFRNFPNQHMSFQAPMNPQVNQTNVIDYVTLAYQALGADRLAAIALGNEPDLYASQFNIAFTAQDYVQNALEIEQIVQNALGLSDTDAIFEAPDIAGYGNFGLTDVFEAGLNSNGLIKYAAEHWYQIVDTPPSFDYATEQALLMSHDAITGLYANQSYYQALSYVQANAPKAKYILSETGSSLAGPPRSFQDAFDAALWLVDFHLYSMSIGVQRIDSTQRPSANHSLWIPDDSSGNPDLGSQYNPGPSVRGPWYGVPLVADFIGHDPGAVVSILAEDEATAYAMFEPEGWWNGNADASAANNPTWGDHGPSKVAIVNLKLWADDLGTPRGSQVFAVPVGQNTPAVFLSRLHADAGVAAQGYDVQGESGTITWAGETWSYNLDDGRGSLVGVPTEVVPVCDGFAIVEVPDSEAVIVYLAPVDGPKSG